MPHAFLSYTDIRARRRFAPGDSNDKHDTAYYSARCSHVWAGRRATGTTHGDRVGDCHDSSSARGGCATDQAAGLPYLPRAGEAHACRRDGAGFGNGRARWQGLGDQDHQRQPYACRRGGRCRSQVEIRSSYRLVHCRGGCELCTCAVTSIRAGKSRATRKTACSPSLFIFHLVFLRRTNSGFSDSG